MQLPSHAACTIILRPVRDILCSSHRPIAIGMLVTILSAATYMQGRYPELSFTTYHYQARLTSYCVQRHIKGRE